MVETIFTSQSAGPPIPEGKNPGTKRRGRRHIPPLHNRTEYSQRSTNLSREIFLINILDEESNISNLEDAFMAPFLEAKDIDLYTSALHNCSSFEGYTELKGVSNIEALPSSTANTSPPLITNTSLPTPSPEPTYL